MNNFYQVTCQHIDDDGNGKIKKITERYLVNAVSVTDFEVKEVKKSRIIDVCI